MIFRYKERMKKKAAMKKKFKVGMAQPRGSTVSVVDHTTLTQVDDVDLDFGESKYGGKAQRENPKVDQVLALRAPFRARFSHLHPKDLRVGRFYLEGHSRVQLLDLDFKLKHKGVNNPNDVSARKYVDVFYNLRSGRYTPYSHCKYCYLEQLNFYREYRSTICCKCGLPTMDYIGFEAEDRFCVLCSLMFKYHPRPHIRCLLHQSGKGKAMGAMYVLYREFFSISSASKPKKKTPRAVKLKALLNEEIWKLNASIRFIFLWTIRKLVRVDFFGKYVSKEGIAVLIETKLELIQKLKEIGPNMSTREFLDHGLKIDLTGNQFSENNKMMFYKKLRTMLIATVGCVDNQIKFFRKMKNSEAIFNEVLVGIKRRREMESERARKEMILRDRMMNRQKTRGAGNVINISGIQKRRTHSQIIL